MLKYIGTFVGGSIMTLYFCEAIKYSTYASNNEKKQILKRHATMKAYGVDMSHINIK